MDLKLKSPEKNNEDSQNMEEWLLESNVDYNSLSELGKQQKKTLLNKLNKNVIFQKK